MRITMLTSLPFSGPDGVPVTDPPGALLISGASGIEITVKAAEGTVIGVPYYWQDGVWQPLLGDATVAPRQVKAVAAGVNIGHLYFNKPASPLWFAVLETGGGTVSFCDIREADGANVLGLQEVSGAGGGGGPAATVDQGNGNSSAAQGWSVRLTNGTTFYAAPAHTQLPAALVGGRLDVNIGASGATVPVSGPLTDTQLRASAVPVSAASLPLPAGAATEATLAAAAASLSSLDVKLANPMPVSAASLPLPAGAATSANQATEIASLASIDSKLTSPLSVTGPLTDAQLRATPVPVSGTVTATASTEITSPLSAFGEVLTVEPTPRIQIDAVEGLISTDVETYTDGSSGSATVNGNLFSVSCGTSVGGYGTIRSRRLCKYRPGQGLRFQLTGAFSTPAASSLQLAGAFNACDGLFFGYSGTSFGILRRIAGAIGIYRLTLTAAPTGAETATITLNGVPFTVTLANTSTSVAAEAIANRVGGYTGYLTPTANGATVTWLQLAPATAAGAYTFSSTGTATGTIATLQAGAPNDNVTGFVPQASWNVDPMTGSGPSGVTLDPTKLNVYRFELGYLGATSIVASVRTAPGWQTVHRIAYPNLYTVPSFKIPTVRMGWAAASLGSTTNLTVTGASAGASVMGRVLELRDPSAIFASTTATVTETAILCVRVRREFNSRVNSREWLPIHLFSSIETANRLVQVKIYINPTIVGAQTWTYLDQANSSLEYSTSAVTLTASTGRLIASGPVPSGAPLQMELHDLNLRVEPGDIMVITLTAASNTAVTNVSINGLEE